MCAHTHTDKNTHEHTVCPRVCMPACAHMATVRTTWNLHSRGVLPISTASSGVGAGVADLWSPAPPGSLQFFMGKDRSIITDKGSLVRYEVAVFAQEELEAARGGWRPQVDFSRADCTCGRRYTDIAGDPEWHAHRAVAGCARVPNHRRAILLLSPGCCRRSWLIYIYIYIYTYTTHT
jgi:hypothetical protein